jgi:predicted KAP-like P-loop ATPase
MLHEKLKIFPDKALGSIDQDKFNRTGFVKVLVRAIRESSSQDGSTVLALLGPWGCGKTSVKNLAVKELEKGPTDPRVMEFCPWQVSGTGKITTLFFEALIGQISKENEVPDGNSKRKNLRLYASLLSKGSMTRPILVVIDDIDRLPSEEIFEVIQIINVNADFPNLVYLLLFDRTAVERSIERSFEHRGRDFLEKIIQGSFHVPALSLDEIRQEFSEQLDAFIKGTQLEHSIDSKRISELFFGGLWEYSVIQKVH